MSAPILGDIILCVAHVVIHLGTRLQCLIHCIKPRFGRDCHTGYEHAHQNAGESLSLGEPRIPTTNSGERKVMLAIKETWEHQATQPAQFLLIFHF